MASNTRNECMMGWLTQIILTCWRGHSLEQSLFEIIIITNALRYPTLNMILIASSHYGQKSRGRQFPPIRWQETKNYAS